MQQRCAAGRRCREKESRHAAALLHVVRGGARAAGSRPRAAPTSTRVFYAEPAQSGVAHLLRPVDGRRLRAVRAHHAALRQAGLRPRRRRSSAASASPSSSAIVWERPFCKLIHFDRALGEMRARQPKLLIVAPMSGHYATLLRGTVEAILPTHDVYITDWIDARAGAAQRRPLRPRRLHRLRHRDAATCSARTCTSWRCASLPCRCSPPSR